jgi:hypothetical protein
VRNDLINESTASLDIAAVCELESQWREVMDVLRDITGENEIDVKIGRYEM